MKKFSIVLALILVIVLVLGVTGCDTLDKMKLVGTWETPAIITVYSSFTFNRNGTGTYSLNALGCRISVDIKYQVKDGHLLISYDNQESNPEEELDHFLDSEFYFQDKDTLVLRDSSGVERIFNRK